MPRYKSLMTEDVAEIITSLSEGQCILVFNKDDRLFFFQNRSDWLELGDDGRWHRFDTNNIKLDISFEPNISDSDSKTQKLIDLIMTKKKIDELIIREAVLTHGLKNYDAEHKSQIDHFIHDACKLDPSYRCLAMPIYNHYESWAKTNNLLIDDKKIFFILLKRRFKGYKGGHGYVYKGITINEDYATKK